MPIITSVQGSTGPSYAFLYFRTTQDAQRWCEQVAGTEDWWLCHKGEVKVQILLKHKCIRIDMDLNINFNIDLRIEGPHAWT